MAIKVYCGRCGKALVGKRELAGKIVVCTKCTSKVPMPTSDLDKPQIRLLCSGCGSKMKAMPNQADEDMQCPKCNRLIHLPVIEKDKPGGRAETRGPRKAEKTPPPSEKATAKPRRAGLTVEDLERMATEASGDTKEVELPPSGPSAPASPGEREQPEPSPPRIAADREPEPAPGALDEISAAASAKPADADALGAEVDEAIEKIDFDAYKQTVERGEDGEAAAGNSKAMLIGIVAGVLVLILIFLVILLRKT